MAGIVMQFEPFQDRLSRDIRNDLAATMIEMLNRFDLEPAQAVAERYLHREIAPWYQEYIKDRLARYRSALEVIRTGPADPFWRALVLWDLRLFFEVHEVLEHEWYGAEGTEKKVLQAMIRAAGAYIKLRYGYRDAAQKMADRALPVLIEQKELLGRYFDPNKLLQALRELTDPPLLLS